MLILGADNKADWTAAAWRKCRQQPVEHLQLKTQLGVSGSKQVCKSKPRYARAGLAVLKLTCHAR